MLTLGFGTARAIPWLAPADAVTSERGSSRGHYLMAHLTRTPVIVGNVAKELVLARVEEQASVV